MALPENSESNSSVQLPPLVPPHKREGQISSDTRGRLPGRVQAFDVVTVRCCSFTSQDGAPIINPIDHVLWPCIDLAHLAHLSVDLKSRTIKIFTPTYHISRPYNLVFKRDKRIPSAVYSYHHLRVRRGILRPRPTCRQLRRSTAQYGHCSWQCDATVHMGPAHLGPV